MKFSFFKYSAGLFLMLLICFSHYSSANAQLPFTLGIKGGGSLSILTEVDNADVRPGFAGGLFTQFKLPVTGLSVQPEVLYTQKGFEEEEGDGSVELDYIEVPVLIKFNLPIPAKLIKPNVYVGPYAAYNINAELDLGGATAGDDAISDYDYGIVAGGGLDINKFSFEIRYTGGIENVFEDSFATTDDKNEVLSVLIGFKF